MHGNGVADSEVEVSLTDRSDNVFYSKTRSNEKGDFYLKWPDNLSKGVYELRARVIDGKGVRSDFSELKVVTVDSIPLIQIGMIIMNWVSALIIIILGLFTLFAVLWYSYIQFRRFRRKVKRTLAEAENTLKTNVQALRRDTEEFHTLLQKAEKKRDLTKEEQMILKKFKKRLDTTEKEIEKKLEAIG